MPKPTPTVPRCTGGLTRVGLSLTPQIASDGKANLFGALWMITAMAAFAVEDSLLKTVSQTLHVGQILISFGIGGALAFAIIARLNGDALYTPAVLSRPMVLRAIFEMLGRLFFLVAIAVIPLSSATVIMQATPIIVVAGAALIFRERVGWRRWLAIFIGLTGVLVILQPGTDGFSAMSILAVCGMLGFAGRDLTSRAAPASLSTPILGMYGFFSVIMAGIVYSFWLRAPFVRPDAVTSGLLAAAVLTGLVAYSSLMRAMRTGDVSAVTPFRYVRLVFGIALGFFWFGEEISVAMIIGSSLIVASGLFILWRGKQVEDRA